MDEMQNQPAIIVYSADGQPRLLVEVKVRPNGIVDEDHPDWPMEIRRAQGHFDCYFLLVTPERMILFLPGDPAFGGRLYGADSAAVLRRQLDTGRFPLRALDEQQLTSLVHWWLMFSQFESADTLQQDPAQRWLVESGLHTAILRGNIQEAA